MLCSTTDRGPSHWVPRGVASDPPRPNCGPERPLHRPCQQEISQTSSSQTSAAFDRWRIRMLKLAARPCHVLRRRLMHLPQQVPVRACPLCRRSRTRGWRGCLGSGRAVRREVSASQVARWTSLLRHCLLWVAVKAQVFVVAGYLLAVAVWAGLNASDFLVEYQILRVVVVCPLLPCLYSILLGLLTRLAVFFEVRVMRPRRRWQLAEPGAELPLKA